MKKLILVTPGIRFNPMGVPVLSVNGTYMNAIAAAGGIPVMLGSTPLAEEYAEMAAGLVITGGESVHPTRYGETFMHLADNDPAIAHNLKAGCNSVRDEMEFAAFEAFFQRKKPILGNSFHRDCAWSVGPGMREAAKSPDGLIEAIEHRDLPVFGVQFHPERMRGDNRVPALGPDGTKLFEFFVNIC